MIPYPGISRVHAAAVAALTAAVILCGFEGNAGEKPSPGVPGSAPGMIADSVQLTGNMRVDFFGLNDLRSGPLLNPQLTPAGQAQRKSPWLAAGLSLVLPGAGEFYSESYVKSAAFLAVEVAAWGLAYMYDKRGNRQTNDFQDFANAHWSVVQYAEYAETHLNPQGGPYHWLKPNTEGLKPWDRVDWGELNRMERDIGGYYSHNLAPYNDQQYYEMIGKYTQFVQGWDAADPGLAPDYPTQNAHQPAEMLSYEGMRATANSNYDHATTMVTVAIINHLVSAIDAAWSAGSYNRFHAEMGVRNVPNGVSLTSVPELKVSYGF